MTTVADAVGYMTVIPDGAVVPDGAVIPDESNADARLECRGVIDRLRANAGRVEPWHEAVLRAIRDWPLDAASVDRKRWHYLIGGEALDWVTLAHRLSVEIPDAIPAAELTDLLFRGRLPGNMDAERFRSLIGAYRYTAHLNFWYGVTVEEALQLAVEDAIRKRQLACCYQDGDAAMQETFRHLYGDTQSALVEQFMADAGGAWGYDPEALSLAAYHEFTYWLFKRRIRKWHPARVASDTRRGLDRLRMLNAESGPDGQQDWLTPDNAVAPALTAG